METLTESMFPEAPCMLRDCLAPSLAALVASQASVDAPVEQPPLVITVVLGELSAMQATCWCSPGRHAGPAEETHQPLACGRGNL